MFDRIAEAGRRALSHARQEAQRFKAETIGTEMILLGILLEGGGIAAKVLKVLRADFKRVREEVGRRITPFPGPVALGPISFSPRADYALQLAADAADRLGHELIGTDHLLLGLIQVEEGEAAQLLVCLGIRLEDVRDGIMQATEMEDHLRRGAPASRGPLREKNLIRWSRLEAYRHLEERPALRDSIVTALQQGRSVALVGREYVGKTSLVIAMARAFAGGFLFRVIDYRMFDEFVGLEAVEEVRPRSVLFVPEGELLTASRTFYVGYLAERVRKGEALVLEFREGGLERFAVHHPDVAKGLVRIDVGAPDPGESARLLASSRERLQEATGMIASDEVLAEADRQARERLPGMAPPWGAILALWSAVPIERERRIPEALRRMEAEIKSLEREKDEAISAQQFETAAQRRDRVLELKRLRAELEAAEAAKPFDPILHVESVRAAIEELAVPAG